MTPEEQRIAIAEFLGAVWVLAPVHPAMRTKRRRFLAFTAFYSLEGFCDLESAVGDERLTNLEYMWREGHIPDYCGDLNAMHCAEKALEQKDGLLCIDYVNALVSIEPGKTKSRYGLVHATAAQRAEAFLKAVGRWKD